MWPLAGRLSGNCCAVVIVFAGTAACRVCHLFLLRAFGAPSSEHMAINQQREMPRKSIYFQAAFFTLASWAAGAIALYYCMTNMSMESAVLQVVFIGLAALTVPHMLLVDGMFRRHAFRPAQG